MSSQWRKKTPPAFGRSVSFRITQCALLSCSTAARDIFSSAFSSWESCAGVSSSGQNSLEVCRHRWILHENFSHAHSTPDAVASNAQELNIMVPAVIQPLMLSSHGIICQGPSPAFTGWLCWCQIPAELAKPSGMLLLGFKLV